MGVGAAAIGGAYGANLSTARASTPRPFSISSASWTRRAMPSHRPDKASGSLNVKSTGKHTMTVPFKTSKRRYYQNASDQAANLRCKGAKHDQVLRALSGQWPRGALALVPQSCSRMSRSGHLACSAWPRDSDEGLSMATIHPLRRAAAAPIVQPRRRCPRNVTHIRCGREMREAAERRTDSVRGQS